MQHKIKEQDTKAFSTYLDKCWKARQFYKDEANKLLYWCGTAFFALAATTGIYGANANSDIKLEFGIQHYFLFNAVFFVCALYYFYKNLNSHLYGYIGEEIEKYIHPQNEDETDSFPPFFEIKENFLKSGFQGGRIFSRLAAWSIAGVYLLVMTYPVYSKIKFSENGINLNWGSIIMIGVFFLLNGWALNKYHREKKKIRAMVKGEWEKYIKKYGEQGSAHQSTTAS